jgi:putative heme transporter
MADRDDPGSVSGQAGKTSEDLAASAPSEPPAEAGAAPPAPPEPEIEIAKDPPPGSPPSRRAAVIRTGLVLGVLAIVFLVILPNFIDYEEVVAAFQGLTIQQILLVTAFGVVAWVVTGAVFSALIDGLSIVRGTEAWLILAGIGASIPLGPWNMGVLWVVIRGWGRPAQAASAGVALYGIFDQLGRLALAPIASVFLLVAERRGTDVSIESAAFWSVGGLGLILFVVATAVLVAIVRSERLALRIGEFSQRIVGGVLRRLGRKETPDVLGTVVRFRVTLGDTVQRRGLAAFLVSLLSKLAWCLLLIASVRVVGVPDDVLSDAEIFAVFAAVFIVTIIPLSPGGAGVPEVLYISFFSTITGGAYQAEISAAVMLYRVFQWFLPIPLAWLLLWLSRRGRPLLPTTAELRGRTAAAAEST